MMDFIELTPCQGKRYCLVIVDMFSKWVEVFPSTKQNAQAVAKALLTEIIPRWGIPGTISSDNGPVFISHALAEVSKYLGFDIRHHCAYHPQSAGAVERENGTVKQKLMKCCDETGPLWVKALPLMLFHMHIRIRPKNKLSPYEVLYGRPPNTGIGASDKRFLATSECEDAMLRYCANLSSALSAVNSQVKAALPTPADSTLHDPQLQLTQPGQISFGFLLEDCA